jgi:hypothetical protein
MRHQSGERRETGLGPRGLQEPLAEPQHIEPYGGEDVPQVHPSAAAVAGPSQAHAAGLARNRPFDAGPAGRLRLKCLRGFPWPGRLAGLILRLGPDGERAPGVALLRTDAWAMESPRQQSRLEHCTLMTAFP